MPHPAVAAGEAVRLALTLFRLEGLAVPVLGIKARAAPEGRVAAVHSAMEPLLQESLEEAGVTPMLGPAVAVALIQLTTLAMAELPPHQAAVVAEAEEIQIIQHPAAMVVEEESSRIP